MPAWIISVLYFCNSVRAKWPVHLNRLTSKGQIPYLAPRCPTQVRSCIHFFISQLRVCSNDSSLDTSACFPNLTEHRFFAFHYPSLCSAYLNSEYYTNTKLANIIHMIQQQNRHNIANDSDWISFSSESIVLRLSSISPALALITTTTKHTQKPDHRLKSITKKVIRCLRSLLLHHHHLHRH